MQVNYVKLDKDFAAANFIADETGVYYGVELRYTSDIFWIKATYGKNDKEQPIYILDGDNIGFIKSGGDSYYEATNLADASVYSISVGKNFDALRLDGSDNNDIELHEGSIGLGFRPSKNFDASFTLGYVDKEAGAAKSKTQKTGIELIYWF
ncbi:MAG: hypothetical protein LBT96_01805 [Campylobacteraceae bacterium]|jgi:hypothetical protein|nr:hypothetical protein [Campylobacteraceae bacterium]